MPKLPVKFNTIGPLESKFKKDNPVLHEVIREWLRSNAKKIRIIRDKGGVCEKCKLDGVKYPWLIDIHHTDPSKKETPGNQLYDLSYTKMQKELKSCILLCAHCHRIFHQKEFIERLDKYADIIKEKVELAHLDPKKQQEKYCLSMCKNVKILIKKGLTYRQMSKVLKISQSAIHKYVKVANLKPNYEPHWQGKITKEVFMKIKELRSQGLKCREIAKIVNVSKTSVLNHWDAETY